MNRPVLSALPCRGSTLTEYALVGVLVLTITIVILQMMSGGLNSAFAMMRNDMKAHQQKVIAAQVAHAIQQAQTTTPTMGLSPSAQALLQQSLAQKLQTTGANGSTEVLAQQLASAAAQLLQEGKINQSQYDILMQLSNQGHKMAQIEGMVQSAVDLSNGDYAKFSSTTFNFEGQTYTAQELVKMIGFDGPTPSSFANTDIISMPPSSAESEMSTFLNLYDQAAASGALADVTADSTVTSAATQIASLGEITEDALWQYQLGNLTPQTMPTATVEDATQMSSSKVCTAGKFKDSGSLCTL